MGAVSCWVPFGQKKFGLEDTILGLPFSDDLYLPGFKRQMGSGENTNDLSSSAFSLVPL